MNPTCFIVAGPNGAGKSTFAEAFLPRETGCLLFVNSDMIARGISPFSPEHAGMEAGRIFFQKIDEYASRRVTFAFESTLSGTAHARRIERFRSNGYQIVIYYLTLSSVELAVERVQNRVREGGHPVPEEDIRRRFTRSWHNFCELYKPLADEWIVFDNSEKDAIITERSE